MSCLGVHFAITDAQERSLLEAPGDAAVRALIEEIERPWDQDYLLESHKFWDALDRCLRPHNLAILGGRQLHRGREYIVSLVDCAQVREVAQRLAGYGQAWLRERYFGLRDYEGQLNEPEFEGHWACFEGLQRFYARAAAEGRAVIFTADQ